MNRYRALAVVVIVALVTMCALFSLSAHAAEEASVTRASHIELAPPSFDDDGPSGKKGTVDLLGNDVSDAVAEYRLDATGSLYEVHSPQTEIPKLGSPKS